MMLKVKVFVFNPLQVNCCLVWDDQTGKAVIIDPGFNTDEEFSRLKDFLSSHPAISVEKVLQTHSHLDHSLGTGLSCAHFGIRAYMHCEELRIIREFNPKIRLLFGLDECPKDDFPIEYVDDGSLIYIGKSVLEVMHTPGHSRGSVCYLSREDKMLFCGDTIFRGSIGRTDLEGGDYDVLMHSIHTKIMTLEDDVVLYPGHGEMSSVGEERSSNPFLEPFNLPEDCEIEADGKASDEDR